MPDEETNMDVGSFVSELGMTLALSTHWSLFMLSLRFQFPANPAAARRTASQC